MSTSTYSFSAWSFTSEPNSFGDGEQNVVVVLADRGCSRWLQRCLREGELCKSGLVESFCVGSSRHWRCAGGQCEYVKVKGTIKKGSLTEGCDQNEKTVICVGAFSFSV